VSVFGSVTVPGWVGWAILLVLIVVATTLVLRAWRGHRTPKWWRTNGAGADEAEREDELRRSRHQWE
jgi:hypothetical protein